MLMMFHNAGSEPDSPRIIAAYPDRLSGLVDTSMVHLQCWVQQGVQDTAAGIVMQVSCKAMTLRACDFIRRMFVSRANMQRRHEPFSRNRACDISITLLGHSTADGTD